MRVLPSWIYAGCTFFLFSILGRVGDQTLCFFRTKHAKQLWVFSRRRWPAAAAVYSVQHVWLIYEFGSLFWIVTLSLSSLKSFILDISFNIADHTELEAIQQLQKDSDAVNVKLYNLLEIFARGNLADYKAFYAANKDVVTDCGIDNDRALDSMRLLTLHNLALNQKVSCLQSLNRA